MQVIKPPVVSALSPALAPIELFLLTYAASFAPGVWLNNWVFDHIENSLRCDMECMAMLTGIQLRLGRLYEVICASTTTQGW